jgi:hypothetical protein
MLKGLNLLATSSLKNRTSFLLHFWASNKKRKLEDVEQQALTSLFVMDYIIGFSSKMYLEKPLSIRERLLDKQ